MASKNLMICFGCFLVVMAYACYAMPSSLENGRQRRSLEAGGSAFRPRPGSAGSRARLHEDEGQYFQKRQFDSLGGGEIPFIAYKKRPADIPVREETPFYGHRLNKFFDDESAPGADEFLDHPRVHQRAFDTLGGGEIPWVKRSSHEKST